MKVRTSIAAVAAAALVGTGAFMLPAIAASARPATHTLQFISVTKASVNFSASTGAQQDTDVNAKGKVVGYRRVLERKGDGRNWGVQGRHRNDHGQGPQQGRHPHGCEDRLSHVTNPAVPPGSSTFEFTAAPASIVQGFLRPGY